MYLRKCRMCSQVRKEIQLLIIIYTNWGCDLCFQWSDSSLSKWKNTGSERTLCLATGRQLEQLQKYQIIQLFLISWNHFLPTFSFLKDKACLVKMYSSFLTSPAISSFTQGVTKGETQHCSVQQHVLSMECMEWDDLKKITQRRKG